MNRHINPITWKHNYDTVDKPVDRFVGQVAHEQLLDGLDFVNEQPTGSSMYQETMANCTEASQSQFS